MIKTIKNSDGIITLGILAVREDPHSLPSQMLRVHAEIIMNDTLAALYLVADNGAMKRAAAFLTDEMTEAETFDRLARYCKPECIAHHLEAWAEADPYRVDWATCDGCNQAAAALRAEADALELQRFARIA